MTLKGRKSFRYTIVAYSLDDIDAKVREMRNMWFILFNEVIDAIHRRVARKEDMETGREENRLQNSCFHSYNVKEPLSSLGVTSAKPSVLDKKTVTPGCSEQNRAT